MDRRSDMTRLIVAFRSFANASKNGKKKHGIGGGGGRMPHVSSLIKCFFHSCNYALSYVYWNTMLEQMKYRKHQTWHVSLFIVLALQAKTL
jgi:hypothetical protein